MGRGALCSGGVATRPPVLQKLAVVGRGLPPLFVGLPGGSPSPSLPPVPAPCAAFQRVLVAVKRVVDYAAKVRVKADKSGEWSAVMV